MRVRATIEYDLALHNRPKSEYERALLEEQTGLIERLKDLWTSYREANASVKVERI